MSKKAGLVIFIMVMVVVAWGYLSGVSDKPNPRYVSITPAAYSSTPTVSSSPAPATGSAAFESVATSSGISTSPASLGQ